jgi:hypothetical protein
MDHDNDTWGFSDIIFHWGITTFYHLLIIFHSLRPSLNCFICLWDQNILFLGEPKVYLNPIECFLVPSLDREEKMSFSILGKQKDVDNLKQDVHIDDISYIEMAHSSNLKTKCESNIHPRFPRF